MPENNTNTTLKRLRNRYRLVVMNDDSYEEVVTFKLSRLSVYIGLSTIFVLLTSENWNDILINFIHKDGFEASLYFVSIIIFGNIMVLNLFLAILLNFISDNLGTEDGNDKDSNHGDKEKENAEPRERG